MEHSEHIRKIAPQDELLQECLGQVKIDSDEKREPTYKLSFCLGGAINTEEEKISRYATSG